MDIVDGSIKSVESKGGESDSDSLEYSNDDRENPQSQSTKDKTEENINKRPPVYPTLANEIFVTQEACSNMQTPKRGSHDANKPNPGPLNLFSPDLSPICHIACDPDTKYLNRSTHVNMDSDYRPDLNTSIDSLDMESEFFRPTDSEETGAEPSINLWRNRLFDLDQEDHSFNVDTVENKQQQDGNMSVQSNNLSVDSDLNYMSNSASVYPTTDAVYNNSMAADMNTSIDSDMRVTKQSLVYPTTTALYESSGGVDQLSANLSINNDVVLVAKYPPMVPESDRCVERKRVTDDESCVDEDIKKQSVLLSAEHGVAHTFDLSNMSLLDASVGSVENYFTFEQDQTLQSLSLLPGSPLMISVYGLNEREILTQRQRSPTERYPGKIIGASGARKPALRPGATTSKQTKQHLSASTSDTEFVSLNSRRRAADLAAQATAYARDTSDLQPSLREPFSIPTSTPTVATADAGSLSRLSSWPKHRAMLQSSRPAASTLETNQSSNILQGVHANDGSRVELDSTQQGKSGPPPSASTPELPVGALYTLIVDRQGHPVFVPVLASPQPAPVRTSETSSNKVKHVLRADQRGSHSSIPNQALPRQNPYRSNFSPPTSDSCAQERNDFNSNSIDLDRVLERALHNGSLSAAKLDERWQSGGETSKPTSLRTRDSTSTPATKKLINASTGLLPKSPFRVGLSADGKEQLLPSADYWKERLLMRDLTSALKAPRSQPPLLSSDTLHSDSPWQENARLGLGGSLSAGPGLAMSAVKQTLWF